MSTDPMILVRGRADTIKRALDAHKINPDTLTAAALCYLAMKLLGIKGPEIDEFLSRGPFQSLSTLWKKLETEGSTMSPQASQGFDPTDPNATITLTQAELWAMIDGAQRSGGGSH